MQGEYALVFHDRVRNCVWYGRDWAGRRSLVKKRECGGGLVVASVLPEEESVKDDGWEEVTAGGLWKLHVESGEEEWIGEEDGERVGSCMPPTAQIVPRADEKQQWKPNTALSTSGPLSASSPEIAELRKVLSEAVRLRVQGVPEPPHPSITSTDPKPAKLAILFSGGVDCTTLARLAHDHLPLDEPIDLLNVAFENPRVVAARKAEAAKQNHRRNGTTDDESDIVDPYALCPDRITGLTSYSSLTTACPGRNFRFVALNIPYSLLLQHRPKIISLMRPHNTEMDLSIATAFYFASRGIGAVYPSTTSYSTTARILMSGLGADELFGGYSRHKAAFERGGYEAVTKELETEINRIGKRNLGRDDRVLSHWGREARYPFLDENVVRWAVGTGVEGKCPFGQEVGEVERGKMVSRLLAAELGLGRAAEEPKRAVQFGARTAKMAVGTGARGVKGQDLLS